MTKVTADGLDLSGLEEFLEHSGHALVLGGPGSGKTTAALAKADRLVRGTAWKPYQKVLFLSFARATIARVSDAARKLIGTSVKPSVELTTYHSFMWSLIQSHGYLIQSEPRIRVLPPHESVVRLAVALDGVSKDERKKRTLEEKKRLFDREGLLDFDLFADLAADLLDGSSALRRMISCRYPVIFVDEFQDTNAAEYRFISHLQLGSQVVALADPDQRIYEFRGADPKRIEDFISDLGPEVFDLAKRNHRSTGTDILEFSNDLLTNRNREFEYDDVHIQTYPPRAGDAQHFWMKTGVIKAIKRVRNRPDWSVGVLVPTRKLMLTVSDHLYGKQRAGVNELPPIAHEVAVDAEGPSLAGIAIGRLLECHRATAAVTVERFVDDLCNHIAGRKSARGPSKEDLKLINGIRAFNAKGNVVGAKRKRVIAECQRITSAIQDVEFTGDPFADWLEVRRIIEASSEPSLSCIASDAKYLRFLRKGAGLRMRLGELWQTQRHYAGAALAVKDAFVREHFIAASTQPRGVHVMTIHKSKGKEFDEVVIYEGTYQDRIVRRPQERRSVAQAKLSLRVASSRAKRRVTILTPDRNPCELL